MSKTALLFDVDGTLWDTTNSTYKAENIITKKYNLPEVTKETVQQCFGYNRVESAKVYFPTLDLDTAIEYKIEADKEKIRIINEENIDASYPKTKETLELLSKDYDLYIVSNTGNVLYLEAFVNSSNTKELFKDLVAASALKISKAEAIRKVMRDNKIEKAIYIGDTIKDKEAANEAGIPFVQALYGFDKDLNEKYKIDSIDKLPDVLKQINVKSVLFATGNESKSKRFSIGLLKKDIIVLTLKDIDLDIDVEENGKTAIENAMIKAKAYADKIDIPVFAMDDTLYFDDVPEEKQPGLFVRRVNGKRLNDEEMIEHYSGLAKEYGKDGKLTCRWIYGMALINNGKEATYTWSKEDFYIVEKRSDKVDPGYPLNSISINKKVNKYFTDITPEDKKLLAEDESDVVDFIASHI